MRQNSSSFYRPCNFNKISLNSLWLIKVSCSKESWKIWSWIKYQTSIRFNNKMVKTHTTFWTCSLSSTVSLRSQPSGLAHSNKLHLDCPRSMTRPSHWSTLIFLDKFSQAWWARSTLRKWLLSTSPPRRKGSAGEVNRRWPQLVLILISFTTLMAFVSLAT